MVLYASAMKARRKPLGKRRSVFVKNSRRAAEQSGRKDGKYYPCTVPLKEKYITQVLQRLFRSLRRSLTLTATLKETLCRAVYFIPGRVFARGPECTVALRVRLRRLHSRLAVGAVALRRPGPSSREVFKEWHLLKAIPVLISSSSFWVLPFITAYEKNAFSSLHTYIKSSIKYLNYVPLHNFLSTLDRKQHAEEIWLI